METVDNAIVALTPGAMDSQLSGGLFWSALLGGFAVSFVITIPVNKWMIGSGKGHAYVGADRGRVAAGQGLADRRGQGVAQQRAGAVLVDVRLCARSG